MCRKATVLKAARVGTRDQIGLGQTKYPQKNVQGQKYIFLPRSLPRHLRALGENQCLPAQSPTATAEGDGDSGGSGRGRDKQTSKGREPAATSYRIELLGCSAILFHFPRNLVLLDF